MTRISYVHGLGQIPVNEWSDRGQDVQNANYLPYNSLTVGEAMLFLQKDRLKMLSRFFPESKELKQAVDMIDNALYAGVSRGVSFIGAVPSDLQDIARIISNAGTYTQPAVRGGIMGRSSIYNGIGEVVNLGDYNTRLRACIIRKGANPDAKKGQIILTGEQKKEWEKKQKAEAECKLRLDFEDLLNKSVTGMGHHMLYKSLDPSFLDIKESRVFSKRQFQTAGIESLSMLAEFSTPSIMYEWLENGILEKNMAVGAGPINSVKSSFILSPDPDALWANYLAQNPARKKWEKMNPGISGIGVLPAIIPLLIPVILAAIKLASDFLQNAREKNSLALASANGFGTTAYQSEQSDWSMPPTQTGGGGIDQNTLLIGGALLVGGYFLMGDDN